MLNYVNATLADMRGGLDTWRVRLFVLAPAACAGLVTALLG